MIIQQQKGNSMIEILIASAIVIIVFSSTLTYVVHIKKNTQQVISSRSRSVQIQKIVQMIMSDPKLFKVNFDASEVATCTALKNEDLPLAWDDHNIYELADCPGCKGRLGYVIQPFPLQSIRGVYVVTIRITHPKLTTNFSTVCNNEKIPDTEQIQMIVSLK